MAKQKLAVAVAVTETPAVAVAVAPAAVAADFGQNRETWGRLVREAGEAIRQSEKLRTKWTTVHEATRAHFGTLAAFDEAFGAGATKRERTIPQNLARSAFAAQVIVPNLPEYLRTAWAQIPIETKSKTGMALYESLTPDERLAQDKLKIDRKAYSSRVSEYFNRIREAFPMPEETTQPDAPMQATTGEAGESEADETAAEAAERKANVLALNVMDISRILVRTQKATGEQLGTLDAVVAVKLLNKLLNLHGAAGVDLTIWADKEAQPKGDAE